MPTCTTHACLICIVSFTRVAPHVEARVVLPGTLESCLVSSSCGGGINCGCCLDACLLLGFIVQLGPYLTPSHTIAHSHPCAALHTNQRGQGQCEAGSEPSATLQAYSLDLVA